MAAGDLRHFEELFNGCRAMKTIRHTETLVYYDGAQVFAGRDTIDYCYIGVMVDSLGGADRYVVAGVSEECLKKFRAGSLDLRTLLLEGAQVAWYLTETDDDFVEPLVLEAQTKGICETDFLPADGFTLGEPSASLF